MAKIIPIYLDLCPAYIPFIVSTTKADGTLLSPTVDSLIIWEEDGGDATFSSTDILSGSGDPAIVNAKVGLWGLMVDKSLMTAGNFYIAYWTMTVDSIGTHMVETFFACNSTSFKATGFSTHNAAAVWTAGSRALSTPADYKADVSSLAIEANVQTHAAAALTSYDPPTDTEMLAAHTTTDAAIDTRSSHNAAAVWTAGSRALSTPANYKADVSALATESNATTNKNTVTGAISTAHTTTDGKVDVVDGNVDSILGDTAELQSSGVKLSTQGKADSNAEADTALTDYDSPTRTEATSDKNEILTKVDTVGESRKVQEG